MSNTLQDAAVTLRFPDGFERTGTLRQSSVQAVGEFPGHGLVADVEVFLTPEETVYAEDCVKIQKPIVLHRQNRPNGVAPDQNTM